MVSGCAGRLLDKKYNYSDVGQSSFGWQEVNLNGFPMVSNASPQFFYADVAGNVAIHAFLILKLTLLTKKQIPGGRSGSVILKYYKISLC
jgi:hypothetical protein